MIADEVSTHNAGSGNLFSPKKKKNESETSLHAFQINLSALCSTPTCLICFDTRIILRPYYSWASHQLGRHMQFIAESVCDWLVPPPLRRVLIWSVQMGLGKTVQAIAVAYAYRQEWPLLVMVPSSLKYTWIEELEKWIPELQAGDINLVKNKNSIM